MIYIYIGSRQKRAALLQSRAETTAGRNLAHGSGAVVHMDAPRITYVLFLFAALIIFFVVHFLAFLRVFMICKTNFFFWCFAFIFIWVIICFSFSVLFFFFPNFCFGLFYCFIWNLIFKCHFCGWGHIYMHTGYSAKRCMWWCFVSRLWISFLRPVCTCDHLHISVCVV